MPRGDDKEAKLGTFGLRLRAWWEGYSPEEYLAWLEARRAKGTTGKHKTGAATSPVTEIAWKPDRIKVANLIWGEGYCGPGGPQHVVDLSKLLGLTPDMSVLIVGGGLGGPARALAGNFGCYVTAYEESAELAAAGTELSVGAGLGRKAPIEHFDFENIEPFTRKFDAAVAKESLLTIKNKSGVLREIFASLKPQQLVLITDYVLEDSTSADDPEVAEWLKAEKTKCHLLRNEAMIGLIERAGFLVRVKEDQSESYRSLIAESWSESGQIIQQLSQEAEENQSLIQTLLDEATRWARLSHLLEGNKLRLMRYVLEKGA